MRAQWRVLSLYAVLTLASVIWIVPVLGAAAIAVLPLDQSTKGWWRSDATTATVANFRRVWDGGLSGYALNSVIIAILSVLITLAAGTLAAYAFARMRFRFKAAVHLMLLTTMIVPVQIILIPLIPWFRTLGLNSGSWQYLGIALVHTAFGAGWSIFMLSSFFEAIPNELIESAKIDGASALKTFTAVALPLAVPGIVSFVIIDFVFVWNDLLMGLTLLDADHRPITVGLANLNAPQLNQDDLISAGSILAILPPLLLFALLNRYYVKGLFAGAVKG